MNEIFELDSDDPIFSSEVFNYIVDLKWNLYAKEEFLSDIKSYLLLLIVYIANSAYFMTPVLESKG